MKLVNKSTAMIAALAVAFTLAPTSAVAAPERPAPAAVAAKKADSKISPNPSRNLPFSGKTTRTAPYAGVTHESTVRMADGVEDVRLQMSINGSWYNRSYLKPSRRASAAHEFRVSIPKSNPGSTHKYRLVAVGTSKVKLWVSKTQTVKYSSKASVNPSRKYAFGGKGTRTAPYKGIANTGNLSVHSSVSSMRIQQKEGSKWLNRKIIYPSAKTKTRNTYKVPVPQGTPGSSTRFRLVALESRDTKLWISPEQVIKYSKQASTVDSKSLRGLKVATSNASNKVYVSTTGSNRVIRLQEKSGKKWVNRTSAKTGKSSGGYVSLPKGAKNKTATFRVAVDANDRYTAAVGKATNVRLESPATYTGYKKKARDHIKKWCPATRIDLFTAKKGRVVTIGRSFSGQRRVEIARNLSPSKLKSTALHECAHIVQFRAVEKYGKSRADLQNRLNRIYKTKGNNGVEQSADCMSVLMGASESHSFYTKKCTGARKTAAKKMLAGKMP